MSKLYLHVQQLYVVHITANHLDIISPQNKYSLANRQLQV